MNKAQMLNMLENIKTKIKQDKLENYELDNRVDELEKIKKDLRKINDRISFLSEFVSDETNYRNNYFALNDEALRFDLKKNVINCNLSIQANKNTISELNEDIAKANETIGSANLEISSLEEELMINGQLLRGLNTNGSPEDEKIINDDLVAARERNEFLKSNIARLQESIKNNNELLIVENDKTAELIKRLEVANNALDKFDNNIVNTQMINTAKRKADIDELETLKYTKTNLEKRDKMLSIDYSMEFEKIYNNLESNLITVEDASKAVESIVNTIPEGYFIEDVETRNTEIAENRKKQIEVQDRIDRLNEKLKDDSKYTVSAFVAERNNAVVKSWESKLNKYNMEKENLNKQEAILNSDLRVYESMLQECNTSLLAKGEELRGFGTDISKEDELRIKESLKVLRKEKQELQNEINGVKSNIVTNSNDILKNENKLERTEKLFNNLKSSLDERNSVDRSQKRLDELKLATAVSTLGALKTREKYINESVLEVVDKAIGVENEKINNNDQPINNEVETNNNDLSSEELQDLRNQFASYSDNAIPVIEDIEPKENEKADEVMPFPIEMSTNDDKNNLYIEQEEKSDIDKINDRFKELGIPAKVELDDENKKTALDVENENNQSEPVLEQENSKENEEELNDLTEKEEEPIEEEKDSIKKRFVCKFKEAKKELIAKAKSKDYKQKLYKFAKKAASLVAILVITTGGVSMCGKLMDKIKNPTKIEDYDIDRLIEDTQDELTKPNEEKLNAEDDELEEDLDQEVENNKDETSDYKEPVYESEKEIVTENQNSSSSSNTHTSNKDDKPSAGNTSTNEKVEDNKPNTDNKNEESDDNKPNVDPEENNHDNSDDIKDPNVGNENTDDNNENEVPEVDIDSPVEAPDAEIEDIEPEVETPEVETPEIEDENLNTEPDSDVTVTPDNGDNNTDVEGDVTVTPDDNVNGEIPDVDAPEVETPEVELPEVETPEVETPEIEDDHIFDNSGDIEIPEEENNNTNDDIIIEDAEDAEIETNPDTAPKEEIFDNLDDTEVQVDPEFDTDFEVTPNDDIIIEDETPEVDNDFIIEDTGKNIQPETNNDVIIEDSTSNEDMNVDPEMTFDNLNIEVNPGETINVETNSGENYEHTNSGTDTDQITFESNEIERESELTSEELKTLREQFANQSGNEVVTEENVRSK